MFRRCLAFRAVFSILVSLVWTAGVGSGRAEAQTFHQIQISNDADDGYLNNNDGTGWHSVPQAGGADWVGSWNPTTTAFVIGYRFPSTGINSGDAIRSAYLKVVSSDGFATSFTCGSAPCPNSGTTFRVYGVAQDNGNSFSGTAGNTPLSVPYTNAYTDYTSTGPGDVHGSCQGNNSGQNTCTHIIDVTNIVKEITSRPGWTNTSAIRFVLLSTNQAAPNSYVGFEDYNANAGKAATLLVNPPVPTVVSSGAWGTGANTTYPTTYAVGPFVYPGASTLLLFLGDYYNFYSQSISQPSVTDSCGNNWKILAGPTNWVGYFYDMRGTVYYVQNPAPCSAGDTITINVQYQEPIFLHFLAVAGSDTTQAPSSSDINSPNPATYTTSATTDPVSLGNSGLLVSWIFGDSDAPHTFTPQAGFTTDVNSTPTYLTTAFENVASPGTYRNQFSISPSDGWQAIILGLQPPGVAAAPVITSATTASGTAGTSFSYQIAATNSPTSFNATGLPAGLSVNKSTGLISGTPTGAGSSTATLSATNATGTGTATLTITIAAAAAPVITSATTASGTVGTSFSYQIAATNSPSSYNATGLPAGLSVNTSTGLISGTPTTAGGWTATLSATNATGTGTATLTITIAAAVTPSIAFVQASAKATSSNTLSVSFAANTLPGDLILVGFDFDSSATPASITDTQGNAFTEVGTQLTSPGGSAGRVYYAKNIKGGADTVTIALSANAAGIEAYLTEYSGVDSTNPIDAQAGASGNAGAVSSGIAKTSYSGDAIFGYCLADWACTVGSGFAARSTLNHNLTEDALAGSPGSYAATATANNGWTMQMVALKPAAATSIAAPVITSATTAGGTVGTSFSYQIAATNSPTSFNATGLPAGLSVNSSTGLISGTPTAAGTSTVTLSATNGTGTGTATLTITIAAGAPVITSATTASGTVGLSFSYQIAATNSPISFNATGLPAGLSVNTSTGLISGTPTGAGTSTVTVSATNGTGTGTATLTITTAAGAPVITSATTANGTVGSSFSYQIAATNSPTSFNATGLPAGLSVNTSTGLISGTPTSASKSTVTLSATNGTGTGTAPLTITIAAGAPVITSATTASGTVGSSFSYQIAATNSPTSFNATGLPGGLSVNTSTGLISGTPTGAGTSTVTLSATNGAGTGKATLTITIAAGAPVITSATTASGTVGTSFSYQVAATNSPTSFNATGLPAGLSVNTSTGLISGTPTSAGTSTVTLSATNGTGTGTATLTLTVGGVVTHSIGFVQESAKAASTRTRSLSISFAANTLAGDLILVGFDFAPTATPTSITDTQGNTFTQVGTQLTTPGGSASRVYYAKNIKGGADTVTIALSASSAGIEAYLTEYSGVDPTNPIDAQAGASGNAGAVSSGTANTSYSGDAIFGFCPADWACTVGSGFVARSTFNHNLIEDALAGSPGSYAATASANNGWSMQMVALKPAP